MPLPMNFADEWEKYRSMVLPRAGEIQTQETKRAFYAGAAMLIVVLRNSFSAGSDATEDDFATMARVTDEVFSFLASEFKA